MTTPTNPPAANSGANPWSGGSFIGDSIAVGTGALGAGQGGTTNNGTVGTGVVHATVGHDTNKILSQYKGQGGSRYTVISAGTNDQGGQPTEKNLIALRNSINSPLVIWIVPFTKKNSAGNPSDAVIANMQKAAAIVRKVAQSKGDKIVELDQYGGKRANDGLHPQYSTVAARVKELLSGVAGGDTPTATDGGTPANSTTPTTSGENSGSNAPCTQGDGSPSFTSGEGTDGLPATASGEPLPKPPGMKSVDKEYITNQPLPPIPRDINYNNAAKNIKLSHYFTLYDVLNTACGSVQIPMGGKTHCNRRWSAYEIVCNLRELCVLVLDPIKHKYRRMQLNSVYRNGGGTSSTSAHDVGWAADMDFQNCGFSRGRLLLVAEDVAKMGIPYDQLLYEYAPGRKPKPTKNPWLHCGIRAPTSPGKLRGMAKTFYNDSGRNYPEGRFVQFPCFA